MQVEFIFSTGRKVVTTVEEFDAADFAKQLNNPQTQFISIGDRVFQKNTFVEGGVVGEETE